MSAETALTSASGESQAERIARLKRAELVEAALAELVDSGWRGLRMQAVATRVGVSRQTVYNTFGGRDGLAVALVEHLTHSFLDGFEIAFHRHEQPHDRWADATHYLLTRGTDDRAARAMLGLDTGDEFLRLLTSRSGPLVRIARRRIADVITSTSPEISDADAADAAEIVARLTLSHVVQAVDSIDASSGVIASMITGFLHGNR